MPTVAEMIEGAKQQLAANGGRMHPGILQVVLPLVDRNGNNQIAQISYSGVSYRDWLVGQIGSQLPNMLAYPLPDDASEKEKKERESRKRMHADMVIEWADALIAAQTPPKPAEPPKPEETAPPLLIL